MNSDEDDFESADEHEDNLVTRTLDATLSDHSSGSVKEEKASGDAKASRDATPPETFPQGDSPVNKPLAELNTKIPEVLVTRSSDAEFDEYALVDAATVAAATALVNAATAAAAGAEEDDGDVDDDESCVTTKSTVTVVAATEKASDATKINEAKSLAESVSSSVQQTTLPPSSMPPTPSPALTPPNTPAIAPQSGSGWGSWKSWGAGLLATASQSVTKMSTEIGQGLGEMQSMAHHGEGGEGKEETESDGVNGDGAKSVAVAEEKPTTETANGNVGKTEEKFDGRSKEDGSLFSFFSSAGKGIVDGGLNVLETVGKKTMQVINETDPGLNKTKTLLVEGKEKVNLSQMLRDAKKAREEKEKEEILEKQKAAFDYWFEEKQGLVSLEALEILSGECEEELESLLKTDAELKPDLLAIREAFLKRDESEKREKNESSSEREEEEEEDRGTLESNVDLLGIRTSLVKLEEARRTADSLLAGVDTAKEKDEGRQTVGEKEEEEEEELEKSKISKTESPALALTSDENDASLACHQNAMVAMGYFVAECVKFYHKTNQMILMTPPSTYGDGGEKLSRDDVNGKIEALHRIKSIMIVEVEKISARFDEKRAQIERDADATNPGNTYLFHEVSRGKSLIREAYRLSIPIMQKCYYDQSLASV